MKQYIDGKFDDQYKPTIGADFLTKDVNLPDRGQIKLQIWDTAGQERFKSIAVSFYRGADACVLVYDICDIKTFQNLEMWMSEFLDKVGADINDFPFIVLGNKADKSEEMMVSKSRAEAWCKGKPNCKLFETSALSKQNLTEAFESIALAAARCSPSAALVDVQDLDNVTLADVKDMDDDKAVDDEVEIEDDSVSPSDIEDSEPEEEPRRAEIRRDRETQAEASKRARTQTNKQKAKKKGRRSSIQGSQSSSKNSRKDRKRDKQMEIRHQKKKSQRSWRNSDTSSQSANDENRSRFSNESPRGGRQDDSNITSPRGGRHSRGSSYRSRRMDSIRLEDDYSNGSNAYGGCCY